MKGTSLPFLLALLFYQVSTQESLFHECASFLRVVRGGGAEAVLQKPEFMRTLEICERLLYGDPGLGGRTTRMRPKTQTGRRHFKDTDIDSAGCEIEFFQRNELLGDPIALNGSVADLRPNARSIRTLGSCCWLVFSRKDYKGNGLVIPGDLELFSPSDWGWITGTIASIKKIPSCKAETVVKIRR